jgi:hypothetical protein
MFLDLIEPQKVTTGYGGIGISGGMGYPVLLTICGVFYEHSISAHPPSSLVYSLSTPYDLFSCRVALNDSSAENSEANFMIYADGILQGVASNVKKNERPRLLEARLHGTKNIELVVESNNPEGCHAVWIDPVLHDHAPAVMCGVLNRVHIIAPDKPRVVRNCIGIVGDDNVADMIDNFLGSLYKNGNVTDCHIVILADQNSERIPVIAKKYRAQVVEVRRVVEYAPIWIKTAAYSLAHLVQAENYLVFDSDMLVLDQIRTVFDSMRVFSQNSILAVRESLVNQGDKLGFLVSSQVEPYLGSEESRSLLSLSQREFDYDFIVNGGLFGGSRKAMLALDNMMRSMVPEGIIWMDQRPDLPWREQAMFNIALARMNCAQELDIRYNTQLLRQPDVEIEVHASRLIATRNKKPVSVLHFNGDSGRERYKGIEEFFTQVRPCEFGNGLDDIYEEFEEELHKYAHKKLRTCSSINSYIYERMTKLDNTLRFIYQACIEFSPESILDIQTDKGVVGGCLTYYAAKNASKVIRVSEEVESFIADIPQEYKIVIEDRNENAFVACKQMVKQGQKFDFIVLDTSMNEKNTSMLIMLAFQLVSENGHIVIHDSANPLCDMAAVAKKLKSGKLNAKSNLAFRPDFEMNKVYILDSESA